MTFCPIAQYDCVGVECVFGISHGQGNDFKKTDCKINRLVDVVGGLLSTPQPQELADVISNLSQLSVDDDGALSVKAHVTTI